MKMPRSRTFLLLLVCLSLGFNMVFPLFDRRWTAEATWWNASWGKYKTVTITGPEAGYSMLINVTYDADMQADFDDLRFIDDDDSTALDYWISTKVNSNYANVWVQLADAGSTIRMYYNNATVSTTGNASNAFVFYDDFSTARGWTAYSENAGYKFYRNNNRIEGNTCRDYDTRYYINLTTFTGAALPTKFALRYSIYCVSTSSSAGPATIFGISKANPASGNTWGPVNSLNAYFYKPIGTVTAAPSFRNSTGGATTFSSSGSAGGTATWFTCDIEKNGTFATMRMWDSTHSYSNPNLKYVYTSIDTTVYNFLRLSNLDTGSGTSHAMSTYYDTVYLRKFTSPEPTASFGAEQSPVTQSWQTKQTGYDIFRNTASWVMNQSGYDTFRNTATWLPTPDTGEHFPSAASGYMWSNPENVYADDENYAEYSCGPGVTLTDEVYEIFITGDGLALLSDNKGPSSAHSFGAVNDIWNYDFSLYPIDSNFGVLVMLGDGGDQTSYLYAEDFGMTIPFGATIDGVIVTIDYYTNNEYGYIDVITMTVYYTTLGWNRFGSISSWSNVTYGWNTLQNASSWLTKQSGYNLFSNQSMWFTKQSGFNTFGNISDWSSKQSGWNTFGSTTSWSSIQQGWTRFGNTSTWLNIQSGYNTFRNISAWRTISSGWNSFGTTTLWTTVEDGYNTFSNNATWTTRQQGWNTFHNLSSFISIEHGWNTFSSSISWVQKQDGWNSFNNTASWQTKEDGWNTFGNGEWQTIDQGWNSFNNHNAWTNILSGFNSFGNQSSWKTKNHGWNSFGNSTGWGTTLDHGWNRFENISTWVQIEQGWNTFNNTDFLVIMNLYPANNSLVCLCTECDGTAMIFDVNVSQTNGTLMNITWYWNHTVIGSYVLVGNNTWHIIPFENVIRFNYNTSYNYTVNVTDGTDWVNRTVFFTVDTAINCSSKGTAAILFTGNPFVGVSFLICGLTALLLIRKKGKKKNQEANASKSSADEHDGNTEV